MRPRRTLSAIFPEASRCAEAAPAHPGAAPLGTQRQCHQKFIFGCRSIGSGIGHPEHPIPHSTREQSKSVGTSSIHETQGIQCILITTFFRANQVKNDLSLGSLTGNQKAMTVAQLEIP